MEKPQWDKLVMVPETLLLVGTSEGVLTSIERAYSLLGEDFLGVEDDDDDPGFPSNRTGGSEYIFEFEVSLDATCGGQYTSSLSFDSTVDGENCSSFRAPMSTVEGGWRSLGFGGVPTDTVGGDEGSFQPPPDTTDGEPSFDVLLDGSVEHIDNIGDSVMTPDSKTGVDYWADLLASAFRPDGPLTAAHREITRLISLHGVAGHVLTVCGAPLGFPRSDEAAWLRWREHRDVVVPRAHDALLRLSSATSAAAAAEDFLRLRSSESPRRKARKDWSSKVKQFVRDARRDVAEARDAVILMRDAVVREFFETWMILKRAQLQACS